ncbi:heme o synthase [Limnovirga soli]|uniref:Protoheme IX farnesyltransferase n=1 Tax=Limnovirga soli TaxID=2656915 RepID=A0A8J8FGA3_9BACT|nr:heme o synthase [Limnovirga soli]NNV56423.1 protoheme IX farnesyltransferase [Limnovirga soli]
MNNNNNQSASFRIVAKLKDYLQLIKITLSFTVVFSCVICYLLAPNIIDYDLKMIVILFLAGLLVTGSANAINQATERDTDIKMRRTSKRPVAEGRMSHQEAYTFALIAGAIGTILMYYYFNFSAAFISLLSLFIYAYVYTPLKKVSAISVLVGGLPGALPCLIGWVAATNEISPFAIVNGTTMTNAGGWILFGLQFLWQFPHFWAIAWVAHNDYTKAGFKLLPGGGEPTKITALQSIAYAVVMIPVGVLPYYFGISGIISLWIVLVANLFIVFQCVRLYIEMDVTAARRVMFSSYIYLPIVLLALLADKYPLH